MSSPQTVRIKPEPVHPTVKFQKQINAPRTRARRDPFQVCMIMNGQRQSMFDRQVNVRFIKRPLEHQDWLVPAALAQPRGPIEFDQRQTVGRLKGTHRIVKTMTVSIGLHDRPKHRRASV